jgi:DNA-binding Lrp family transcriptional regulator
MVYNEELKNVDEIDHKYLCAIEKNPGIRQFEIANVTGEKWDSKVRYRILELERLGLITIKRGRKNVKCYLGPNYFKYLEYASNSSANITEGVQ